MSENTPENVEQGSTADEIDDQQQTENKSNGSKDPEARYNKLISENAERRIEAKKLREQLDDLQKMIKKLGGEDQSPEDRINSLVSENRSLKLKSNFSKVSKQIDADEELTFAYLHAKGELDGLDPDDKEGLTRLISTAVDEVPKLRATQVKKTGDNGAEKSDTGGFDMNAFIRKSVRG